jgi:hypothetical protein
MATSAVPAQFPHRGSSADSSGGDSPRIRRDFFVYGANFVNVAAQSQAQTAVQIQADSDFELQKLTFFADEALADQTDSSRVLPLMTIQLVDTGTGRQLFNTPIAIPSIMGDGKIPFILPTTKVYAANSSVTVAVANYSGASSYNLRVSLIGTKIFRYG